MPTLEFEEGAGLPDWRVTAERRGGVFSVESSPLVAPKFGTYRHMPKVKARPYRTGAVPDPHDHPTDAGYTPVVNFDLNGTLTPAEKFPLLPPFEGVKEVLDFLVSGGVCCHITTAALGPQHSPEVNASRQNVLEGWLTQWSLPISYITGKVPAHVFYDDRMVPCKDRPWDGRGGVGADIIARLDKRFDKDKAGIWRRKDIPEQGDPVDAYPPDGVIYADVPRALSTPVFDYDLHRCLFQASTSKREGQPKPGSIEAITLIFDMGYQLHPSCAGWDPATHTDDVSRARLGGLQQQLRQYGVPYDELVAKSHADVFVDDKGIWHSGNWTKDLPAILTALATPASDDEVTGLQPTGLTGPLSGTPTGDA